MSTSVSELQFIAERLSAEPVNHSISVYDLNDRVSFASLRELIVKICQVIEQQKTPENKVVVQEINNQEDGVFVDIIGSFLKMLNYPQLVDFADCAEQKNNETLVSVIHFLLADIETHAKRSFLSDYFSTIDVPETLKYLEDVSMLAYELQSKQDEFKEMHMLVENYRKEGRKIGELKEQAEAQNFENRQLALKYEQLMVEVGNLQDLEASKDVAEEMRLVLEKKQHFLSKVEEQDNFIDLENRNLKHLLELQEAQNSNSILSLEDLINDQETAFQINKRSILEVSFCALV